MQNQENKIVLHACCAICSGYPISLLKDMGYSVVVYFYNPNIYPEDEYKKRLDAERKLCEHFGVDLIEGEYEPEKFYSAVKGYEQEPEKGSRCDICFDIRLRSAAEFAKRNGITKFTTSIVISPHKDFNKLSEIGEKVAIEFGIEYIAIDFKKKDGFLKTNTISKQLNLYRQNYCGCQFSVRQ